MKRLALVILAAAACMVGIAGCGLCEGEEGECWTSQDENGYPASDDWKHTDPEIEARAEMY